MSKSLEQEKRGGEGGGEDGVFKLKSGE